MPSEMLDGAGVWRPEYNVIVNATKFCLYCAEIESQD